MPSPKFVFSEAVMIGDREVGRISKASDGYRIALCGDQGNIVREYPGICQTPEDARKVALRLFGDPPGQGVLFEDRTQAAVN